MVMRGTFRSLRPANVAVLAVFLGLALVGAAPRLADAYCGDANDDKEISAADALIVLRSAIGIGDACVANCECDVDFDREITANDALQTLKAAVSHDRYFGCGFQDECFDDADCSPGYVCGTDPAWDCDAACVPE